MPKFNWVLSTVLVSATIVSGLPTQSMQRAAAQTHPFGFKETIFGNLFKQEKDNKPTAGRPVIAAGQVWEGIFGDFFNQPKDNKPTAGGPPGQGVGRGPICALTPRTTGTNTEIWSDRPLFVWQGPFKRIELHSVDSNQKLWSKKLERERSALYDGELLKRGRTYEWRLFFTPEEDEDTPPFRIERFRVMDAQNYDRIQQDLQKLDEELKTATPEQIALQRAKYFAQKQLWSDALQEAYSVKNPSQELTKTLEDISKKICTNSAIQTSVQSR
jgi:hypothetical protein